jgi:hypothetical protein
MVSLASSLPCELGLVLRFPNCSLLRAARPQLHGPFTWAPPLVCFRDWWRLVIVTGTSLEGRAAFLFQLDGQPWTQSLRLYPPPAGVLPVASSLLYVLDRVATALRTRGRKRSPSWVTKWHFLIFQLQLVAPRVHGCVMGVHDVESKDELIGDTGDEQLCCQWSLPQSQCHLSFLQNAEGLLWCCLQGALLAGFSRAVLPWLSAWR